MSAPRTPHSSAALAAATVFGVTVLLGLGPAAADPPAVDFDPCTNTLSQVTQWPGTLGDGSTHFSDSYEGYLLRQPACNPAP
jgi:hypothetical protein